jgi:hypothetical protein
MADLLRTTGARIRLPDPAIAPGFRDSIRGLSAFKLNEVSDTEGIVTPGEGLLTDYPYFRAHRLCDASTPIDEGTFKLLAENPAYESDDEIRTQLWGNSDDDAWRHRLLAIADATASRGTPGSDLSALQARLTAIPVNEIPGYLARQAPEFFQPYPNGSWWFVRTDPLLTHRMAFVRALLAQELTPDLLTLNDPVRRIAPALDALQEHSLTNGVMFGQLLNPLLLCFPLSSIGFGFEWSPHCIVFLTGMPGSLLVDWPPSLNSMYEPHLHASFDFEWVDQRFFGGTEPGQLESLLQWWVGRLNQIYSHIADPCRFTALDGAHDVASQIGWQLTFERMLTDAIVIRTSIQRADTIRQEAAFDLLDKAESLLGYSRSTHTSGQGFEQLLRRSTMVPRLRNVWDANLPVQLRSRFDSYSERLYDDLYAHVRSNALEHRLTRCGVKVWDPRVQHLETLDNDTYVSRLIREVRNSSHGLMDQLSGKHRFLLATHSGKLPPQLPEVAVLLALAIVADAENLCAGTWLRP